jgi:hypothetical protein
MGITMEERFGLLLDPPKILKVRIIVAALHNVDIDRIPENHGMVKAKMRQALKRLDLEYDMALKVLAKRPEIGGLLRWE